ncbi:MULTISPECIES: hypothetical protein [unclassified Citrobacter]|uniref:hypothetical protein n=1 Tax=unclassified Citrobacter TaxID=2644389 RepID=UPI002304B39A|nr:MULTISPECIES: hypothetical protein [unclassified Citrobacter]MDA8500766.1 hypothetical protein [Citrobacter sp. Igbk 17]MDA8511590.1 hypothetical protein [Citrobacter sp. Igbk 14]MDA8515645.1 hypothetical protein [Citrobacter sp. Igbk 16]
MLRLLSSVELQAISTRKQFIDFTRDAIPKDDGINLSFIIELGLNDNEEDKCCYLILGCKSQVNDIPEGEVNPLKVEITIAYKFNVLEPDVFHQADDELKATLLSNLVYLDFRSKLTAAFSSVGLSKIRFPLTFEKIKSMS